MRCLADMGVDVRVVEWLRQRGHDAVHLREEGLQRLPNGEIFEKARSEGRGILTFDLDFGEIVALSGARKSSLLVFRLRNTRAPHVINRLSAALADSTQALEAGAVVVVEESRHRVRFLPVGQSEPDPQV